MTLFERRVHKLQSIMKEQNVDVCFFFHYTEIAYFTPSHLGNLLFIPVIGLPVLFTRKVQDRVQSFNPYIEVINYRSYKDILPLLPPLKTTSVAITLNNTSYSQITKLVDALDLSLDNISDAQLLLNKVTLIKTPEEIEAMKIANDGIVQIFNNLKAEDVLGKTEAHISGLLYSKLRDIGFIGEYQFRGITPFTGPAVLTKESIINFANADITYSGQGTHPVLATGSGNTLIEKNIPFIIDIMHNQSGVFADVTRTFIVGEPNSILIKRYDDLVHIFEFIQKQCQVGISCTQVYEKTLEYVEDLGYKDHFMGLYPNKSAFIGHNIGAWVDEFPAFSKNMPTLLTPNMTFALEPKFYFEDYNSPGLESTFVQRESGIECLTNLSTDLIVL